MVNLNDEKLVTDKNAIIDIQQETWIKLLAVCSKFNSENGKNCNLIFTIAKNEAFLALIN